MPVKDCERLKSQDFWLFCPMAFNMLEIASQVISDCFDWFGNAVGINIHSKLKLPLWDSAWVLYIYIFFFSLKIVFKVFSIYF